MAKVKSKNRPKLTIDHDRNRERALWDAGIQHVAGVDEAGIGPLAGPVVAAAVVLPPGCPTVGFDDSKKLSPARREEMEQRVRDLATAYRVVEVWPEEIDEINIYHAGLAAMRRALEGLGVAAGHALIDGRALEGLFCPQTRIVGGDACEPCIAAASILAKVHRDRIMVELDRRFPGYGLAQHKGYPTQQHRDALVRLGPTEVHRLSYTAVQKG